jgi:hypothetical protein
MSAAILNQTVLPEGWRLPITWPAQHGDEYKPGFIWLTCSKANAADTQADNDNQPLLEMDASLAAAIAKQLATAARMLRELEAGKKAGRDVGLEWMRANTLPRGKFDLQPADGQVGHHLDFVYWHSFGRVNAVYGTAGARSVVLRGDTEPGAEVSLILERSDCLPLELWLDCANARQLGQQLLDAADDADAALAHLARQGGAA